jgi:hypothetical protein
MARNHHSQRFGRSQFVERFRSKFAEPNWSRLSSLRKTHPRLLFMPKRHQVTLLDGRTTVSACYQGESPNSAALPHQERFRRGVVNWQYVVDGLIREVRRFGLYSRSGRFFLPLSERLENIQPVIWTEFLKN